MKLNRLLVVSILLLAIFSVGAVCAAQDNVTADENAVVEGGNSDTISISPDDEITAYGGDAAVSNDESNAKISSNEADSDKLMNETPSTEDNSCVIYVGKNITDDGGNGSYENPFECIEYACDSIEEYKDSITLNIFEGTYYLNSTFQFNTSNLIVQSVSGKVTFKNLECIKATDKIEGTKIAFTLIPEYANLTMNNIIFDYSDWNLDGISPDEHFTPFYSGIISYLKAVFNNCTFTGANNTFFRLIYWDKCKPYCIFNSCNFENCTAKYVNIASNTGTGDEFNYCTFSSCNFSTGIASAKVLKFDGCWFGQSTTECDLILKMSKNSLKNYVVVKYAIFNVSENYLGNNLYEIIGKMMWNDTTNDNIDKLPPLIVRLSSSSGTLPETAILENGTFKVIYTSNATGHDVNVTLDNETIILNFNTTDMIIKTSDIIIGQNQNATVTLPQAYNGTVIISVNNKSYELTINDTNVITYTIPDVLPLGTYEISAIFADAENHIYAFNSTNFNVSKISGYTFDVTQPSDVKVGDAKTITVTLPSDATGNITVTVGEKVFEANVAGNVTTIEVSGFVAGNNTIKVIYSGDEKYEGNSTEFIIPAEKVAADLNNSTLNIDVAKGTTTSSFNIALPSDATGNLTVNINGKDYTQELVNGSATVNIPELSPGNYNAIVTYSGDGKYSPITTNTTVSIPKPVLTSKNFAMLYTSGAKYTVRVTLDGKAVVGKKVTFTINGKKTTATTDKNGYASVKITLPPKSKAYTVTATYLGVKVTNKVTVKSIITAKNMNVKKSAKKLTIKVTLKKVNKKYLKGKYVTLKFNGKTYKVKTNSKGVATFTINKKVLSKLKAGKKYTYKVTYGKDSVSKKVTVKK